VSKTCGVYGRAVLSAGSPEEATEEVRVWAHDVSHLTPEENIVAVNIFAVGVGLPPKYRPVAGEDGRFTVPLTGEITLTRSGAVSIEQKIVWDGMAKDFAAERGITLDLWWVAQ
jgi:hypothetical protein